MSTNPTCKLKERSCDWNAGLGCTTTSQADPPPRLQLLGANWRQWHLQLKNCHYPKRWVTRQKLSPNLGRQWNWAELHSWRTFCHLGSINRLGRCRATGPRPASADPSAFKPRGLWANRFINTLLLSSVPFSSFVSP